MVCREKLEGEVNLILKLRPDFSPNLLEFVNLNNSLSSNSCEYAASIKAKKLPTFGLCFQSDKSAWEQTGPALLSVCAVFQSLIYSNRIVILLLETPFFQSKWNFHAQSA